MTTPIESISAVTLATPDMAAAVGFYEALGFERRYGGPEAPFTSYRVGSGFLNLQHDPRWVAGRSGVVWGRVILWVDDVDALHHRAVAAGLTPLMVPADAPWGERYFHLRDPSGHELSFARPFPRPDRSTHDTRHTRHTCRTRRPVLTPGMRRSPGAKSAESGVGPAGVGQVVLVRLVGRRRVGRRRRP